MKHIQSAFCQISLVLAVASFTIESSRVHCPHNLTVEQGENVTVLCSHNGSAFSSAYWYINNPSLGGPILRMERGKPGGKEYGKGHYDITSTGAMVIHNAVAEDESVYWFLSYFDDGEFETYNVTVNVSITPNRPCPVIDVCSSCEPCTKVIDRRGSLKCSVIESRPKVTLKWIVKYAKEIEFYKPNQSAEKDVSTEAWNSTTEIAYFATSCDQYAVLQCVAENGLNLLQYWNSSIELKTGNCSTDTVDVEKNSRGKWITIVASSATLVAVLVIVSVFYIKNKQSNEHKGEEPIVKESLMEQEMQEEVKLLTSCLSKTYDATCTLTPLPWEKPVPVNTLFTNQQCEVTQINTTLEIISCERLLSDDFIAHGQRVIITGHTGYGKTAFSKQLVKCWIKQKKDDYILIFIPLKHVTQNSRVADIVHTKIRGESCISVDDIERILKQQRCVILLDGLQEMTARGEDGFGNNQDKPKPQTAKDSNDDLLTIGSLLSGKMKNCSKVQVWVTSRHMRGLENIFPNRTVTVKLKGLSQSEIKEYIKKALSFYNIDPQKQTLIATSCATKPKHAKEAQSQLGNDHDMITKSSNSEMDQQVTTKITENNTDFPKAEIIDEKQTENCPLLQSTDLCDEKDRSEENNFHEYLQNSYILDEFMNTPHLLFLIIHIFLAKSTNKAKQLHEVSPINVASLIHCVISVLEEKYKQESGAIKFFETDLETLHVYLEEFAFQSFFKKGEYNDENCSSLTVKQEELDKALAIGILEKSHNCSSLGVAEYSEGAFLPNEISFCHHYLRDYFAACSIAKDSKKFEKLKQELNNPGQEPMIGVLKFSSLFDLQSFSVLCDELVRNFKYNWVIECLYGRRDYEDVERITKKLSREKLVFVHVKRNYYQEALRAFCKTVTDMNMKMKEITFMGQFHVSFLQTLELPLLSTLQFFEASFDEKNFVIFLHWLYEKNIATTVRFQKCTIPDQLSLQNRNEVKGWKVPGLTVQRRDDSADLTAAEFSYDKGIWIRNITTTVKYALK